MKNVSKRLLELVDVFHLRYSKYDISPRATVGRNASFRGDGVIVVSQNCTLSGRQSITSANPESKIVIGKETNIKLNFQMHCEGSGKILIGEGCKISNNVSLICQDGCTIEIGDFVSIGNNVQITSKSIIRIGNNSSIGQYTTIMPREKDADGIFICGRGTFIHQYNYFDTTASIFIGDDIRTGPFNVFYTHDHSTNGTKPIWDQPIKKGEIKIGNGSWIGAHTTILMGVDIGEGVVIGAGAVVTKPINDFDIVGGVPAKVISSRLTK